MKTDAAEILQRLYDSEINFEFDFFWHNGFRFRLGDGLNGYKGFINADTFEEGLNWLANAAIAHYPESEFAKWWNNLRIEQGLDFPGFSIPITFEDDNNNEQD